MTGHDPATGDLLNDYLDRIARGRPADPRGLDPALTETVRRMRARAGDTSPDPAFVNRLAATLRQDSASRPGGDGFLRVLPPALPATDQRPAGAGLPIPRERPGRRWWPFAELAAVAALLLVLIGGLLNAARVLPVVSNGPGAPAATVGLYVGSDPNTVAPDQRRLTPLDPQTLADQPGRPSISLAAPDAVWIIGGNVDPTQTYAMSADGSTLVDLEPESTVATTSAQTAATPGSGVQSAGQSTIIIVRDGRTGAIRRRIRPPTQVAGPFLSTDGKRLVVLQVGGCYVYDTASGRLLTTIQSAARNWSEVVVDPAARRLYSLETVGAPADLSIAGPWSTQLVAYDLTTGKVGGKLSLPGVLSGLWLTHLGGPYDLKILTTVAPALAIAPDGRQLAVVATDTGAVTLIDATRLTATRTFTPTHPTSLSSRLFGFLPLGAQSAEAKGWQDTARHAVFSPDGHRLYVFGVEVQTEAQPLYRVTAQSRGRQRIDLETGTIVASGLPDTLIDRVLPAPDGRTLYVFGPTQYPIGAGPTGPPYRLQRLAAATLKVEATRTFDSNRWLVVRAG